MFTNMVGTKTRIIETTSTGGGTITCIITSKIISTLTLSKTDLLTFDQAT